MKYVFILIENIVNSVLDGIWSDVKPSLIRGGLFLLIFAISFWIAKRTLSWKLATVISLVVAVLVSPVINMVF